MSSVKLRKLSFETPAFRKLGNLSIPISDRITLVAGHNGIGKSTILGLIANGSGLRDSKHLSYFNRNFDANLNEIVHLDFEREYEEYKDNDLPLPMPNIEYEIDGQPLVKRCTPTARKARREVRVVPRNNPHKGMTSSTGIEIGPDAKVPLPTLYLGMTRMLPVGESNPNWVMSSSDQTINKDDAAFIQSFISDIIGTGMPSPASRNITTQGIKGTKKTAKHPEYPYSPKCISLGQDSLSAIATALASFQRLQREWPEYPGGLLVIDEIDAGFHPHAQKELVTRLGSAARKLNLQIVATTHSVGLIEVIHPDANLAVSGREYVDSVVYLTDTLQPRLAKNYTLEDIRRDMSLTPGPPISKAKPKVLKIYLEDPEAHFFLERLLTPALKRKVKAATGAKLKAIPLSAGCENLKGFVRHDPYFRTVLIMLDADAHITGKSKDTQNIVKLPGGEAANGAGLSPEKSLHEFIKSLASRNDKFAKALQTLDENRVTSDFLNAHLLKGAVLSDRVTSKKWMNARIDHIKNWKIVELWISSHSEAVKKFETDLLRAATATAALA